MGNVVIWENFKFSISLSIVVLRCSRAVEGATQYLFNIWIIFHFYEFNLKLLLKIVWSGGNFLKKLIPLPQENL